MWSLVFLFAMKMEFTRPVVRAVRARGPTFAHAEGGGAPAPASAEFARIHRSTWNTCPACCSCRRDSWAAYCDNTYLLESC